MFVMTTKVNKKKIFTILGAVAAFIAVLVLLLSNRQTVSTGADMTVSSNDDRIRFLASFGWEVVTSPVETSQVRIPTEASQVFERYNALQKAMGYDLTPYAGKTVMRYVYTIKNYPGATEPVYATVLIANNRIIGGDITNTAATGKIQGFAMGEA
jgi:hypothetical protein